MSLTAPWSFARTHGIYLGLHRALQGFLHVIRVPQGVSEVRGLGLGVLSEGLPSRILSFGAPGSYCFPCSFIQFPDRERPFLFNAGNIRASEIYTEPSAQSKAKVTEGIKWATAAAS